MPQDSLDRIREALTRLPTCNRAELTAEWLRLYRTKPPAQIGRNLLMAAVAYRLQEQILGGLQPELRRQLRAIAGQARHGGEPALAAPRLKPGTKLLRDWQGHTPRFWSARMASCGSRHSTVRCRKSPARSPAPAGRDRSSSA
jgi:hypothetical protein